MVDASMAIAWVHSAQATAASKALLRAVHGGAILAVPSIWCMETANALLVLERRGKIAAEDRSDALTALAALGAEIDHEMSVLAFTRLSALAAENGLSVYDAAYLELAVRTKLPLACKDGPLAKAAKRIGVRRL